MKNKIGPILLSGLIIGPILGSGVVLLPPLAYEKLGNDSLWAWLVILFLGAIFAVIFSKLSVLYPGEGGMTIAIEEKLGKKYKLLSSYLMIFAVSFGPTAVLLTSTKYLSNLNILSNISPSLMAIILVIICFVLLIKDLKFISTLSFIFSTVISVVLLLSSALAISYNGIVISNITKVSVSPLLSTTMLLFWAIIGFEIICNYSNQVKDIKKTIPLATIISIIVITVIYLATALAVQSIGAKNTNIMTSLISVLFGSYADIALSILVTGLCISTYLLIVGALGRLVHSLSSERYLPQVFMKKNKYESPINGILYFTIAHITVLTLSYFNILNLEIILSAANGFFLANALLGIIASFKAINCFYCRIGCIILAISLTMLLLYSKLYVFLAIVLVFALATKSSKLSKAL